MDKYNNPSNNFNDNNDNPWEYQPDDISNTQELPVISTEPAVSDGDEYESSSTSTHNSFDTNAPETEHKSHIGRNLLIGAVAVAAVAGAVALFNGNTTNAAGPEQPISTNQTNDSGNEVYSPTASTEPDRAKMQDYKNGKLYQDGLTVQEFANSCGFNTLSEVCDYYSDDSASRLQYEMSQMGYHANGYELMMDQKGELLITVSSSFTPNDDSTALISLGVEAYVYKDLYHVRIYNIPSDGTSVEYDTDTIPTTDEAAQMLADNS